MRLFRKGSLAREVPFIVVTALVASILVKTFLIHFFFIPSGSMENTLKVGDRIGVNKLASYFSDIRRGEVVVFRDPANWLGTPPTESRKGVSEKVKGVLETVGILPDPAKQFLIKRTIGVSGDHVVCCNKQGQLTVNGVAIKEPYIFKGDKPSETDFNVTVPQGFIWVMGDHRAASADSRYHTDDIYHGMVPIKDVVGRAVVVIWPFNHWKFLSVGHDLSKVQMNKASSK